MKKVPLFLLLALICSGLLLGCDAGFDLDERDDDERILQLGEEGGEDDDDYQDDEEYGADEPDDEGLLTSGSGDRSLYLFGDSWVGGMQEGVFQAEVRDRGFDKEVAVLPFGVGGTTMAQWGNDEDELLSELLNVIVNDPKPNPIVFFTLSGNDYLDTGSAESVPDDLRKLLSQLEASRSDLQIVFAPYDVLNPAVEPEECDIWFSDVFGSTEPAVLTQLWLDLYEETAVVANEFDRVTAVNTYGTLQGRPGNPDINAWSPVDYWADCIHLTDEGYGVYLDTVFDEALTPMLGKS